jgi:hypothetical protein
VAGSRALFGPHAPPALVVYERGGDATATLTALAHEGLPPIGIQPKGQRAWHIAEEVRQTARSARGTTEGIMGTRKTDTYGFNKPKERLWQTLEMAGPRSILSCNLHKLMRDLVRVNRGGAKTSGQVRTPKHSSQRETRGGQEAPIASKEFCDTF